MSKDDFSGARRERSGQERRKGKTKTASFHVTTAEGGNGRGPSKWQVNMMMRSVKWDARSAF